jgi:hypothetical protein
MRIFRLVATGTALLIVSGCADSRNTPHLTAPVLAASPARQIQTSGHFDAIVDFSTLTLTPRGRNCLLQVNGQLVFTGTIEGTATGQTTALVFAPCSDVATSPPGTFRDVFKSELAFEGTVDGEPARANLLYMGRVQPGGQIAGRLVFSNGVAGRLEVEARVAVGGEYSGSVVVR